MCFVNNLAKASQDWPGLDTDPVWLDQLVRFFLHFRRRLRLSQWELWLVTKSIARYFLSICPNFLETLHNAWYVFDPGCWKHRHRLLTSAAIHTTTFVLCRKHTPQPAYTNKIFLEDTHPKKRICYSDDFLELPVCWCIILVDSNR